MTRSIARAAVRLVPISALAFCLGLGMREYGVVAVLASLIMASLAYVLGVHHGHQNLWIDDDPDPQPSRLDRLHGGKELP
jgi:hypothetical protein